MTSKGKTQNLVASASLAIALAFGTATSPALAMGNADSWGSDKPDLSAVTEMIDAGKYDLAIEGLEAMLADDPKNADLLNYLAYSQRKSGDYDSAAQNYERALMINPEHIGALEYQGELFLQTGKPDMARENLARLEKICGINCNEYKELAGKITQ
ncbi:tetratricopeptide repeat protein [Thalassospira alkalitolerans]|uniref:tetratricopeptide repeat protein n=1 Tax=Thalassospira alkalitolerans TaxID=1293890 RepID=UPI003AA9C917